MSKKTAKEIFLEKARERRKNIVKVVKKEVLGVSLDFLRPKQELFYKMASAAMEFQSKEQKKDFSKLIPTCNEFIYMCDPAFWGSDDVMGEFGKELKNIYQVVEEMLGYKEVISLSMQLYSEFEGEEEIENGEETIKN